MERRLTPAFFTGRTVLCYWLIAAYSNGLAKIGWLCSTSHENAEVCKIFLTVHEHLISRNVGDFSRVWRKSLAGMSDLFYFTVHSLPLSPLSTLPLIPIHRFSYCSDHPFMVSFTHFYILAFIDYLSNSRSSFPGSWQYLPLPSLPSFLSLSFSRSRFSILRQFRMFP